jgi:TonB-like protein
LLAGALGCATGSTGPAAAPDACPEFVAARPQIPRAPEYPATARSAGMSGESTHEILVDRNGRVREVHTVGATFFAFAASVDAALRKSTYYPATLGGKPVASRFWVRVPFGPPKDMSSSPARNRVTAFVPGKEPADARLQLAGKVRRITVVADVTSEPPAEVTVVLIAPGGEELVLVRPGTMASPAFRKTIGTGEFLAKPGDYHLRMRRGIRAFAESMFTIAADADSAIVNACGAP